ncbi:MAG: YwbE family protein [Methanobacterium sp.]|jgi:uncharacterized repeat protein (TIGR03833 family)|nr:YwbE family protein [Methanobacterium sp.]
MNGQHWNDIKKVQSYIILKKDQHTGKRTSGIVKDILTRSSYHPHGIKVRPKWTGM